jgi:predicted nuclease with TOPRIM domain
MESIFSFGLSALSLLPEEQLQEWFDLFRNLDRKHSEEIKQLKDENSIIKEEKTQLDAKVKALTEENEKLKTELAAGHVSAVNNMELLLKGLETRLNANAAKQEISLQQSNTTLVEYINKNFEAHTKTVQDSVVASMDIVKTQAENSEQKLQALHCMQVLSDSGTVPITYCTKKVS